LYVFLFSPMSDDFPVLLILHGENWEIHTKF
jgi:hypothetical protein